MAVYCPNIFGSFLLGVFAMLLPLSIGLQQKALTPRVGPSAFTDAECAKRTAQECADGVFGLRKHVAVERG